VTHEPVLAWAPLKDPRWVYERGAKEPEGDGRVQPSPLRQRTRSCMQPLRTPLNKLAGIRLARGGVIVVASPLTSLTGSPGAAADGGDSGRPQQGLCGFLAAGQASHLADRWQPLIADAEMAEALCRVLLHGPPSRAWRGPRRPLGTKRGKPECRKRRRRARGGAARGVVLRDLHQ
jgi:hypothetical protein